jgi:hypothetical protein
MMQQLEQQIIPSDLREDEQRVDIFPSDACTGASESTQHAERVARTPQTRPANNGNYWTLFGFLMEGWTRPTVQTASRKAIDE